MPKIVVPVVAQDASDLVPCAQEALCAGADLIEWRSDFLCAAGSEPDVTLVDGGLATLREAVGDAPILFTFRSFAQGGHADVDPSFGTALVRAAIESGNADLVDVELTCPDRAELLCLARDSGTPAVVSYHDFASTPPFERIYAILQECLELGAAVCKVAVMANDEGDELSLMAAVSQFSDDFPDSIACGISMGELGAITRISGEFFGSALTFCSANGSSAPGQLDARLTKKLVAQLHEQGYNPHSSVAPGALP